VRVLITGAGGQLGRDLQAALAEHELRPLSRAQLDVTDVAAVDRAVAAFRPDVAVHTAALTDTTRCEREPDLALAVNAGGARNVAAACARAGAAMVYISSNEVFDGTKHVPYREDDEPNAINAYGRSKLAGERLVRETLAEHYIVRTAWLYGLGGDHFVERVLRRAAEGGALVGVTDETATPTWTGDLAQALARLVETRRYGIYHLTNAGEASRYEWVQEIARLAELHVEVRPVTAAEFRASLPPAALAPAKPPYSVLANEAAARLGIELRPWREALREYFAARSARHRSGG
jgi:dTDP-4-dehydrorhamnose reductase